MTSILARENFPKSGNDELTHKKISVRSVLAITTGTQEPLLDFLRIV